MMQNIFPTEITQEHKKGQGAQLKKEAVLYKKGTPNKFFLIKGKKFRHLPNMINIVDDFWIIA